MAPFTNIMIIGVTGSIGSIIVKALVAEPSLKVTALVRASSKSTLPAGIHDTVTIPDEYPVKDLVAAFRGQDVVINTVATAAVVNTKNDRFIDAAIAAGVKRYVPSEFGLNNANPAAQAQTPVFKAKGEVQAYLRAKADQGLIEWTNFSPGLWVRWSLERQLMGFHIAEGKITLWDDGETFFSATTEENTALAVLRALTTHVDETRNKNVFLQDIKTSQKELLATVEKLTGRKFEVERLDGESTVRELKKLTAEGDPIAPLKLIELSFAMGIGAWFEAEDGEILNETLGLPKTNVDEITRNALEAIKVL